jgi:hypothetical protein
LWRISGSNQQIKLVFDRVTDFIVKGRDPAYPVESGAMLALAGFTDGSSFAPDGEFYVEPSPGIGYLSFLMNDMSAFLVEAGSATMRRV